MLKFNAVFEKKTFPEEMECTWGHSAHKGNLWQTQVITEPKLNLANQKNSTEVTNWNMSKDIFTKNRDDSKQLHHLKGYPSMAEESQKL